MACMMQQLWGMACLLLLSILSIPTDAATLADWRSRTVYQVLTDRFALDNGSTTASCAVVDGKYCGGSWRGIANKLDYIQGMNFDAIWISPVVGQLPQSTADGQAYTAYWAQDLYTLNSHFGTSDDLQDLVKAAHDRGMYVMLDVVVNHMGYAGKGWTVNYSVFNPFNSKDYFHDYCEISDSHNQTNVEVCWLGDDNVALADLRTEDQDVRNMYGDWISQMVKNYTLDGLRLDTAVNVEPDFFPGFLKSSGVFATGETMSGNNEYVCQWAETIGSILNYPIYYPLTQAFASDTGSIGNLVSTIYTTRENCPDPTTFGLFSENHDVERFASMTDDISQAKNVITYTMMGDGIPIIYQGQEQHMKGGIDPYTNRAPLWQAGYDTDSELYKHIMTLVQARQHFLRTSSNYSTSGSDVIYQDYHSFAMRKGPDGAQVITLLNNNGNATSDFELDVNGHDYAPGTPLTEVLTCTNVTVNATGSLIVPMGQGLPRIIFPTNLLHDSGLCGNAGPPPPAPYSPAPSPVAGAGAGAGTAAASNTPSHGSAARRSSSRWADGPSIACLPLLTTALTLFFASTGSFLIWKS